MERQLTALRQSICGAALLLLALTITALLYFPALGGPFVFDDVTNILLVPEIHINTISFDTLSAAISSGQSGPLGRPISVLSFALSYYFAGMSPTAFKSANLAIHLLNGVGVFLLARALLRFLFQEKPLSWATTISAVVASVWLLHPLNATTVLYTVQRMTGLSALFTFYGLVAYVHGRQLLISGQPRGALWAWSGLVLGCALAALSKENGVLLLPLALLIETAYFRLRAERTVRNRARLLVYIGLLAPISIAITAIVLDPIRTLSLESYQFRDFALTERLMTEARVLWFYVRLIVIPSIADMGMYHDDIAISRSLLSPPTTILAVGALLVAATTAIATVRRYPVYSFAVLWFLIGHSLESSFIPLEIAHEHRNYLPSFGIVFGLVLGANRLVSTFSDRRVVIAFAAAYLCLLAFATSMRVSDWRSEEQLYKSDARRHPFSARSQVSLGVLYHDNKMYDLAEAAFLRAHELNPVIENTVRLIQHYYIAKKMVPERWLETLEREAAIQPFNYVTLWTLGNALDTVKTDARLYVRLMRIYDRLISRGDISLRHDWKVAAHSTLGLRYFELGLWRDALNHYSTLISLSSRPFFFVQAALSSANGGDFDSAHRFLESLHTSNPKLSKEDDEMQRNAKRAIAELQKHADQR